MEDSETEGTVGTAAKPVGVGGEVLCAALFVVAALFCSIAEFKALPLAPLGGRTYS